MKFGRSEIELPLIEIDDAKIVARSRVAWLDRNCALELLQRIFEQTLIAIQEAQIVVCLCVQLITLKKLLVVKQRVLKVSKTMEVDGQAEVIFTSRH